jgi:two-component system response regulator HydG
LAEGKPRIEASDLPPEIIGSPPGDAKVEGPLALAEVERLHILRVLEKMGGSRKETARALGIGANTLWRKLRQYEAPGRRKRH